MNKRWASFAWIVLANQWGRVQVPLGEYFEENRERYLLKKFGTSMYGGLLVIRVTWLNTPSRA